MKKIVIKNKKKFFFEIAFSFLFSLIVLSVFRLYCDLISFGMSEIVYRTLHHFLSIKHWSVIIITSVVAYFYKQYYETVNNFIYSFRFLIAFCIFILCVIFNISGSSIGMWCTAFGTSDSDIILGASRVIRSDEWACTTSMEFSQYYNHSGKFPYFSDTIRGCKTDVFSVCTLAAKTPLMIFRPFHLGYLFLSPSRGLSFFWCGRLIALFMISFEFGQYITGKNKKLSLATAFLITYAPAVQWWFSTGLVDMLIYLQLSILMLYRYMNSSVLWKRIINLFVILICAGGFVLTLYPAWMIPLAYIIIIFIVWTIVENYKNCKMKIVDWISIALTFVIFCVLILLFYYNSRETIKILGNTAYPGKRFETGGGGLHILFVYITNIWSVFWGNGLFSNACENAYFIDFFPLCLILPLMLILKEGKRDLLSILLLSYSSFLGIFCVFGFFPLFSKISFFSNTYTNRAVLVFGYTNVLLLIRTLSIGKVNLSFKVSIPIAIVIILVACKICNDLNSNFLKEFKTAAFAISGILFAFVFFCLLSYDGWRKNCFVIFSILILLESGLLVNPIRHGTKSVENISVLNTMKKIHNEDIEAKWVIENLDYPIINSCFLVGAPVVNGTNSYPNLEQWALLDEQKKFENIYNRYAHIVMYLDDVIEPEFSLFQGDYFYCRLNISDLKKLDVTYIMTNRKFDDYEKKGLLSFLEEDSGYYFYKVN